MNGSGNLPIGPGAWAFVAFFVLAIALWLLVRNMNSRMRRMAYRERERVQHDDAASAGAATGLAAAGTSVLDPDARQTSFGTYTNDDNPYDRPEDRPEGVTRSGDSSSESGSSTSDPGSDSGWSDGASSDPGWGDSSGSDSGSWDSGSSDSGSSDSSSSSSD